ncbi:hypothetical protein GCM10010195_23000 [Kitasatospora griseola]|nr:hypothetical protein GCM10010195_23000 [Kitasatospora griseola]
MTGGPRRGGRDRQRAAEGAEGDGPSGPRELGPDEAGRPALARLRSHSAGGRAVTHCVERRRQAVRTPCDTRGHPPVRPLPALTSAAQRPLTDQ